MTFQVHVHHRVEGRLVHLEAHRVADDAGVVDEDVEPTPFVDRLRDEAARAVERRDVVTVRDGGTAGGDDLVDDRLRRAGVASAAFHRGPEIVDHDARAVRGEQQRVAATDAPAGAGDDRDLAFEDPHSRAPSLAG